jgi:hypothetical protein
MSLYVLQPHIFYCCTRDGVVLLNLKTGKYGGMVGEHAECLSAIMASGSQLRACCPTFNLAPRQREVAEQLANAGIITRELNLAVIPAIVPLAQETAFSVATKTAPRIRMRDVYRFLISCAAVSVRMRHLPLERTIATLRFRKNGAKQVLLDEEMIRALVNVFFYLRPLIYTTQNSCLYDSMVLMEFLSRYGLFPMFVIGVSTSPFLAHSWVQAGTLALNDTAENTRAFTPILAV